MSEKRHSGQFDPDYEDYSPSSHQTKRLKLMETDGKEHTVSKIQSIIRKQFQKEIECKRQEIYEADQRIQECREALDRLRACVVASYYTKAGVLTSQTTVKDSLPSIHPTTKKYLGKTLPSCVQLGDGVKLEPPQSTSHTVSDHGRGISGTTVKTELLETANTQIITQKLKSPVDGNRGSRFKDKKCIVVGNVSRYIPLDKRDENDQATHKWMVYVRGPKETPQIRDFVEKIWFFLHPSYRPNDLVEISEPPFHLTRRGWGEFPVRVQLHFRNQRNKRVDVIHQLKLDRTYTGLQTLGAETVVEIEVERDIQSDLLSQSCRTSTVDNSESTISSSSLDQHSIDPTQLMIPKEEGFTIAHVSSPPPKPQSFTPGSLIPTPDPDATSLIQVQSIPTSNLDTKSLFQKASISTPNPDTASFLIQGAFTLERSDSQSSGFVDLSPSLSVGGRGPRFISQDSLSLPSTPDSVRSGEGRRSVESMDVTYQDGKRAQELTTRVKQEAVPKTGSVGFLLPNSETPLTPSSGGLASIKQVVKTLTSQSDQSSPHGPHKSFSAVGAGGVVVKTTPAGLGPKKSSQNPSLNTAANQQQSAVTAEPVKYVKCVDNKGRTILIPKTLLPQLELKSKVMAEAENNNTMTTTSSSKTLIKKDGSCSSSNSSSPPREVGNPGMMSKVMGSGGQRSTKSQTGVQVQVLAPGPEQTAVRRSSVPPVSTTVIQVSPSMLKKASAGGESQSQGIPARGTVGVLTGPKASVTTVQNLLPPTASTVITRPAVLKSGTSPVLAVAKALVTPMQNSFVSATNKALVTLPQNTVPSTAPKATPSPHPTLVVPAVPKASFTPRQNSFVSAATRASVTVSKASLTSTQNLIISTSPKASVTPSQQNLLVATSPKVPVTSPQQTPPVAVARTPSVSPQQPQQPFLIRTPSGQLHLVQGLARPNTPQQSGHMTNRAPAAKPTSANASIASQNKVTSDGSVVKQDQAQLKLHKFTPTVREILEAKRWSEPTSSSTSSTKGGGISLLRHIPAPTPSAVGNRAALPPQPIKSNNPVVRLSAPAVPLSLIVRCDNSPNSSSPGVGLKPGAPSPTVLLSVPQQQVGNSKPSLVLPHQPILLSPGSASVAVPSAVNKPGAVPSRDHRPVESRSRQSVVVGGGKSAKGGLSLLKGPGGVQLKSDLVLTSASSGVIPLGGQQVAGVVVKAEGRIRGHVTCQKDTVYKQEKKFRLIGGLRNQEKTVNFGGGKLNLKELLEKQKEERGPREPKVPGYRLSDFRDFEDLLRMLVRHYPLVADNPDRTMHPYCATSTQEFLSWNVGKRRAAELTRVSAIRSKVRGLLLQGDEGHGIMLWDRRAMVVWCRYHGYTPLDREITQSLCTDASPFVSDTYTSTTDVTELIEQLRLEKVSGTTSPQRQQLSGGGGGTEPRDIDIVGQEDLDPDTTTAQIHDTSLLSPLNKSMLPVEYLPTSPECEFVHDTCSKIGVRLKPIDLRLECERGQKSEKSVAVCGSVVEEILWKSSQRFVEDLVRSCLAVIFTQNRLPDEISADHVYTAIAERPECDFLTNNFMGKKVNDTEN